MIGTGDFDITLSTMDRPFRQRINKEIVELNIDQMNLKDIFWTFYPKSAEYTFFSSTHRTFARLYVKQQNKSKHIQGDRNYIRHLFWPQSLKKNN